MCGEHSYDAKLYECDNKCSWCIFNYVCGWRNCSTLLPATFRSCFAFNVFWRAQISCTEIHSLVSNIANNRHGHNVDKFRVEVWGVEQGNVQKSVKNLNFKLSPHVNRVFSRSRVDFNLYESTKGAKHKNEFAANFSSFRLSLRCELLLDEKCNNSYLKNLLDCYQLHTSTAIL